MRLSRRTGADRPTHRESLCKMRFDLSSMECRELCHGQSMGLLLAGHTRSIGAVGSGARGAIVQALYLSVGFGDCKRAIPCALFNIFCNF